ncbi:MAG: EamA family transporter [Anaerolineales bacterium]|nr:EamA family transporter [Anaerolineales bacterium]MCX7609484.1 EamA family transporter [Anaerolineales bacterium]MDW8227813.1 EamA family transporter [Anaerolineales bacterium]
MTSQTSPSTRGYAVALGSAAILSTTAVFIRYLTQTYTLPALVLAFWRDLFLAVSLCLILWFFFPARLRVNGSLGYLFIYGAVLAVFNSVWTLSVAFNGAAVATVLAYSSAAFTALLGHWILKETLSWAKGIAIIVSLSGCTLVAGALNPQTWTLNPIGISTGIVSGLLWATYSLMGRSASRRGLNPWTTLLYTFGFATVFLLGFNLGLGKFLPGATQHPGDLFWLGTSWSGWGILFLLSIGPTLGGFGLYNVALTLLPSSVANLIATSEPVWTALIAYAFLGERLTGVQILGSLMVLGGVLLLRLYENKAERSLRWTS